MTTRGHRHRTDEERPLAAQADQALIDPYQVLGLTRRATPEDIKKAYFAKVREYPPEREPELFKRIRAAYDALRTPEAKAATDLFMLHPPVPYEPYKRAPAFDLAFHDEDWLRLAQAYSELDRVDFRSDFREIKL
jgi:curved DNA-binding protein CbpA